jgi:hypothetical protein
MPLFEFKRRSTRRRWYVATSAVLLASVVVFVIGAVAALPNSNFEIDTNANLVVNGGAPAIDWLTGGTGTSFRAGVTVKPDKPSGSGDDSFGQGTKEDTAVPTVVSGSIPPNKSDLTTFGVYLETNANGRFLNVFWHRVQDPTGTTNMDFEFNQSSVKSANGITPVRTAGDLLIQYDLANGGTNPQLFLSRWVTSGAGSQCEASNSTPCWGARVNISSAGDATGTINTTAIPANQSGGLGNISARTFGEAQVDFDALTGGTGQCVSFGSAYLKSRSSDSFTAALKDFIAPEPVNVSTCGRIVIHKVTENGDASFGYSTTGGLTPSTFNLSNGGTRTYSDATQVQPGSYSVSEATIPAGWSLKSLVCTSTGTGTSHSINGATVSITMAAGGVVDCTYTNHINVQPSITTTLSDDTIEVGDTIHDSATLTGATANAGGTVTYTVYTDTACSAGAQSAGTVTVTNGVVPDSDPITFNSTGDFYWQAVYSGDANNLTASSVCTSEHLVVAQKKPSIATTLSATSVEVGAFVHDSATLTGATSNAGGTVTYTVYSDTSCSQDPRDAGTKAVTNGSVADSNSLQFNSAGDFYWQAVYSGDANNEGATSVCTSEHLVVTKKSPGMTTAPNLIPNDDATISGGFNPTGTITFKLFSPSDATCSGAGAYSQTVTVNGNGTYSTTNTSFVASTLGTWRWLVTYSGDGNNNGTTSECGVERFTLANS